MNKQPTPTAEEFLKENCHYNHIAGFYELVEPVDLIEFAKFHVTQALKACAENAKIFKNSDMVDIEYIDYFELDKNSILNAYPLNNIQ